MFYTGKVCSRHPELLGQRRTKSGHCHLCVVERMKDHRNKNGDAVRKRRREWLRAVASGTHVPRKYRKAAEVQS
jgi:hypothetical protein